MVTNRHNAPKKTCHRRAYVPLLLVAAATVIGSGCFQHQVVGDSPAAAPPAARVSVPPLSTPANMIATLGQDDPRLGMAAVAGTSPVPAADLAPTTIVTRWLKTTMSTTLWSGADTQAASFTELPDGSFLRATGPEIGQRQPVYYVGDGLLRRPGNGWVDSAAVDAIDPPAPGQVPAVDADANQPLPGWVQAHRATTLWSGPDDQAAPLTDLPQWTFLKVAAVERDGRLLVNYAGDYATRQAGIGWVDQATVGPAGDPGRWVTNHRATALWSGVDDNAVRFNDLPQWTKLRIVEGAAPDASRMKVEFFGDGFSRLPGMGWIGRADIGPITPPVPLPSDVAASAVTIAARQFERHTFASGEEFIDTVGAAAQKSRKTTGVPASVTVAQAILESDWGRSRLTRQGNNLFGIKALGSATGPAGVVSLATWEYVDGSNIVVQAPFKAYFTLEQSIDDHGGFFARNRRYADALAVAGDAQAFAQAIQDDGYATDPSYASKLIRLMDRYDLYRFD